MIEGRRQLDLRRPPDNAGALALGIVIEPFPQAFDQPGGNDIQAGMRVVKTLALWERIFPRATR